MLPRLRQIKTRYKLCLLAALLGWAGLLSACASSNMSVMSPAVQMGK